MMDIAYNDRGQRVLKKVYGTGETYLTYYVRDAAGNIIAIYSATNGLSGPGGPTGNGPELDELTVYGASRLGIYRLDNGQSDPPIDGTYYYQLTDHLGNVRAVIGKAANGTPFTIAKTDYYPFGMPMPNRNVEGNYRYKFQGQEKDPETGMEAFELRLWDARIGRWLTVDPKRFHHSPYLGMANNPVRSTDPDGGSPCPPDCDNAPGASQVNETNLYGGETYVGGTIEVDLGIMYSTAKYPPIYVPYKPTTPTPSTPIIPPQFGILTVFLLFQGDEPAPAFDPNNLPKSEFSEPSNDDKRYVYRAMRNNNGMPEIGDNSLAQLGVRDADVRDFYGRLINPVGPGHKKGMSVTPWYPALTNPPPKPPNKPLWRLNIDVLSLYELALYQDEINHSLIIPATSVDIEVFRRNVHQTSPHWEIVE